MERIFVLACVVLAYTVAIVCAQTGTFSNIVEYDLASDYREPFSITAGPDGALWFTLGDGNAIGRITTSGAIIVYPLPSPNSNPAGITAGPDGAMWFVEEGFYSVSGGNKVGRITTSGVISEFPIPTAPGGQTSAPKGITAGPDGALWFTEFLGHKIGRITTAGVITEYPALGWYGITTGPDGALWFTEPINAIGRITTTGVVSQYALPTTFDFLALIAPGPDGALWFTNITSGAGAIGRITTTGTVSQYALSTSGGSWGITAGPDGAMWFTDGTGIGRVTTSGLVTQYPAPSGTLNNPFGMTVGPDGGLWFVNENPGVIARAPACGLGLAASFANHTLTMDFALGTDRPAIWGISAGKGFSLRRPIRAISPPHPFTLKWRHYPNRGMVEVKSSLSDDAGKVQCSEWTTVDAAQ